MSGRNDLTGWSLRATARYAGLGTRAVSTLLRLDPHRSPGDSGPLTPLDVLVVRVLAEMAANRSVNKDTQDARTARLQERDLRAISETRLAHAEGRISPATRLLAYGATARLASKELEVLTVLDEHPGETVVVLPIGVWLAEINTSPMPQGSKAPMRHERAAS